MAVVTVSRQRGSGALQVIELFCQETGLPHFGKEDFLAAAQHLGLSLGEVVDYSEERYRLRGFFDSLFRNTGMSVEMAMCCGDGVLDSDHETRILDEKRAIGLLRTTVSEAADRGDVLIIGRGGQGILQGRPGVMHVRIVAPVEQRVANLQASQGCTAAQAQRAVEQHDRTTAQYLRRFHGIDPDDPTLYHLVLNTAKIGIEGCVAMMRAGLLAIAPVAAQR